MSDVADNGMKYPNNIEGWGRLVLDDSLSFLNDKRQVIAVDRWNADGFEPALPPQIRRYLIEVEQPLSTPETPFTPEDLKVTLAWTERPPAKNVLIMPVVNDLNLRVRKLGCTGNCLFQGNDFSRDGFTIPRAVAVPQDRLNNVEQVLLQSASNGRYCVEVIGQEVNVSRQGYALVMSGAIKRIDDKHEAGCPNAWPRERSHGSLRVGETSF